MKNINIQEREFLIECLAKGSTIPEDFREKLFPITHKEYELRYVQIPVILTTQFQFKVST